MQGCDGPFCFGPFLFFSERGDLRLSEVAEVPGLPAPALFGLAACPLLAASRRLRQRRV